MPDRKVAETTVRVRYAETDQMGIVYHANYLIWFELGRGELLWQQGGSYADLEETGYYLPVTEAGLRFVAPARYGDLVTIRAWAEEVRSRSVTFGYQVVNAHDQTLATGWTKHICTDKEGQVRKLPQQVRDLLKWEVPEVQSA